MNVNMKTGKTGCNLKFLLQFPHSENKEEDGNTVRFTAENRNLCVCVWKILCRRQHIFCLAGENVA